MSDEKQITESAAEPKLWKDLAQKWAYLIWNAHAEDQFQYQGIEDKLRQYETEIIAAHALARSPEVAADTGKAPQLYRPKLHDELLTLVNEPIVRSLLYDADLLPEQLSSQKDMTVGLFAAYNRLEGVLLTFKYLEETKTPTGKAPLEVQRLEEIFKGVTIPIGLEQQGHIPTVEKMLDEGRSWDEIGKAIGWYGPTARDWYIARARALLAGKQQRTT